MSRPIGVGLVGYGMSGRVLHAPLLASHEAYEFRVVADPRLPALGTRLSQVRVPARSSSMAVEMGRSECSHLAAIHALRCRRLRLHVSRSGMERGYRS